MKSASPQVKQLESSIKWLGSLLSLMRTFFITVFDKENVFFLKHLVRYIHQINILYSKQKQSEIVWKYSIPPIYSSTCEYRKTIMKSNPNKTLVQEKPSE